MNSQPLELLDEGPQVGKIFSQIALTIPRLEPLYSVVLQYFAPLEGGTYQETGPRTDESVEALSHFTLYHPAGHSLKCVVGLSDILAMVFLETSTPVFWF